MAISTMLWNLWGKLLRKCALALGFVEVELLAPREAVAPRQPSRRKGGRRDAVAKDITLKRQLKEAKRRRNRGLAASGAGGFMAGPPGSPVLRDLRGFEKMSVVLNKFVAPYFEKAETREDILVLVTLAASAWNAALEPPGRARVAEFNKFKKHGLKLASDEVRAIAEDLFEEMIVRKEQHYPLNRRKIVSFEYTDECNRYHLNVMSTIDIP
jgi:hypothetical protein